MNQSVVFCNYILVIAAGVGRTVRVHGWDMVRIDGIDDGALVPGSTAMELTPVHADPMPSYAI